jgi:hypothetical protein
MLNTGQLIMDQGGTALLTTTYPQNQWFNLRVDIDLTTNVWELFIDNVSQGTFSNPINSVGILNLYPVNPASAGGNNLCGFWVDDVSYDHTPATLPAKNAGVTLIGNIEGCAGDEPPVKATVRNLGTNQITSFDIEYSYNGGAPVQESVGPITLNSLESYEHQFTNSFALVPGNANLTVTVSNVNGGGADDNPADDSKTNVVTPFPSATGKVVLGEVATGTWCQFCGVGHDVTDKVKQHYTSTFAPVEVHVNDPMEDTDYKNAFFGPFAGGSTPSGTIDRGTDLHVLSFEQEFWNRVQVAPTAILTNGATFNAATRELEVSVSADFQSAASGSWQVGVILTEDGVTGVGTQYNQVNAYSNDYDPLPGYGYDWDVLPSSVSSSIMVYNAVARAIVPSFTGAPGSLPTSISNGSTHVNCFTITLPAGWDENNINILSFLRNPAGRIDNAGKETFASALANGLANCSATGIHTDLSNADNFKIYPNPTNGTSYVEVIANNNETVILSVMDMTGKTVATRNYQINGASRLPIVTNNLDKGIYIVTLTIGEKVQQQKLIVQ